MAGHDGHEPRTPKFVRNFGQVGQAIQEACRAYNQAVKAGTFPSEKESFVKSDCSDEFLTQLYGGR